MDPQRLHNERLALDPNAVRLARRLLGRVPGIAPRIRVLMALALAQEAILPGPLSPEDLAFLHDVGWEPLKALHKKGSPSQERARRFIDACVEASEEGLWET